MIWFWLIAVALVVAVLAILLRPLMREAASGAPPHEAIAGAFRRQLSELDADLAQGRIAPDQAEAARTEITRRLLATAGREHAEPAAASPGPGEFAWRAGTAVAIAAVLPAASLAVYLTVGTPAAIVGGPAVAAAGGGSQKAAELAAAAARIKQRLKEAPDDLRGWVLLARTEATLERYAEAEAAYRRAIALAPGRADLHAELGEALVLQAQGAVTPAAQAEFAKAPDNPRSRFYAAEAAAQRGDVATAKARFEALLAAAPADAPWRKIVKDRLAALASDRPAGSDDAAAGGPSAADIAAAQRMTPAQRATMIRGMVARLAARLKAHPQDAAGWLKLARAYRVLGEGDKAVAALRRANRQIPGNLALLTAYMESLAAGIKDDRVTPDLASAAQRINALDAKQPDALWYLGEAAAQRGDRSAAAKYWTDLVGLLPAGSSQRRLVQRKLDALR